MSLDLVLEDVDTDDVAAAEPVFVQLMITGTARTSDPEDIATALEGIEDAAKVALTDVEMMADTDGTDFDGDLESNPRALFAAKVMTAEMVRQDAIEEARRIPMTDEERATWDKNENENRMRRSTDMYSQRLATTAKAFQAAEKWAAREDLTVSERCHGVAWQLRNDSNDTRGYDGDLRPTVMHPGNEYIDYYDTTKADDIKNGMARSALGLFT
jgi:hypothetical protein